MRWGDAGGREIELPGLRAGGRNDLLRGTRRKGIVHDQEIGPESEQRNGLKIPPRVIGQLRHIASSSVRKSRKKRPRRVSQLLDCFGAPGGIRMHDPRFVGRSLSVTRSY